MMVSKPIPGNHYRHRKGGIYRVITLAKHTETGEEMVVYERQEDGKAYVRPLEMFTEPRFMPITQSKSQEINHMTSEQRRDQEIEERGICPEHRALFRGGCEYEAPHAKQETLEDVINVIRLTRLDAENPNRDEHEGIEMLRTWLRGLHMKFVEGWDQDSSQDHIAELLGEHPREHARFTKVDPG